MNKKPLPLMLVILATFTLSSSAVVNTTTSTTTLSTNAAQNNIPQTTDGDANYPITFIQTPSVQTPPVATKTYEQPQTAQSNTWRIVIGDWEDNIVKGNQKEIDKCDAAVAYGGILPEEGKDELLWLAGHNYCGYAFWANLEINSYVKVVSPQNVVTTYKVYGHKYIGRQGGSSTGLIKGDLTLQTCKKDGTVFTYAQKI